MKKEEKLSDHQLMERDWAKYLADESIRQQNEKRINDRLLSVLARIKGDLFVRELKDYLSETNIWGHLEIVNYKSGELQDCDDFSDLTEVWVNQNGDDFAGDFFILLKTGKYLKANYSC